MLSLAYYSYLLSIEYILSIFRRLTVFVFRFMYEMVSIKGKLDIFKANVLKKENIGDMALALCVTDPGLICSTDYGLLE